MMQGISSTISALRVFEKRIAGSCSNLAPARFNVPQGIEKSGKNVCERTPDSGDTIGRPRTKGYGSIVPNTLEASEVDIGREVVNIILTRRGFQANLNMISVQNEMAGDLIDIVS